MEVRELPILGGIRCLWASIVGFHPKEVRACGLSHASTPKTGRFPQLVDTSSQVGTLDEGKLDDPTLEEVPATYSPTIKTLEPSSNVLPLDIAHLCEEAIKALGDWLAVKSSIDACQWKLVSKFSMTLHQNESKLTLHQNESKTEEAIKEAKALCAHSIREAETTCAHSIKEAGAHCSTAIREAEVLGASQASSIQQSHAKGIQHLEEEAVKEESRGQLNFLSACQDTLEASPLESCSILPASYQVLLGHTPTSHLFNISQGASPSQQGPAHGASSSLVSGTSPRPK